MFAMAGIASASRCCSPPWTTPDVRDDALADRDIAGEWESHRDAGYRRTGVSSTPTMCLVEWLFAHEHAGPTDFAPCIDRFAGSTYERSRAALMQP